MLADQVTGFMQADHSAAISLAQTDQVITANIGAGEPSAQSPIHYATPNGNGNGSQGSPWSLAQANANLQAGDTLYLAAGNYVGSINPNNSGTAGNPIRIMAAPGLTPEQVHVRQSALGNGSTRISPIAISSGRNYIIVEGFTVSFLNGLQVNQSGVNIKVDGSNVTIRNMRVVHDASEAEGPFPANADGKQVTHREHVAQQQLGGGTKERGVVSSGARNLVENNLVQHMFAGVVVGSRAGKTQNVVRGNYILDPVWDGIAMGNGDTTLLGHVIENNVITGAMGSDGITINSGMYNADPNHPTLPVKGIRGVIVRNNAIFNSGENSIDLKGTKDFVIEGNYFWRGLGDNDGSGIRDQGAGSPNDLINDTGGGEAIARGSNSTSDDIIIRNNVIADSNGAMFTPGNGKLYNNTILNNRTSAADGSNGATDPLGSRKPRPAGFIERVGTRDAMLVNNIVGDHGYEVSVWKTGSGNLDGNTYFNTFQTPRFSAFSGNFDWTSLDFAGWQAWLQSKNSFAGNEANSQVIAGGPSAIFVNVPAAVTGDLAQFDFSLQSNSPAIDSGVFLTKTTGAGSGTSMTVADSKVFFDGYGVTLGDEIQLDGQTARARITNINGNTLTLSSALTWTNGQGVSLAYEGAAPDAGAIEFTGVAGSNTPPVANNDQVTVAQDSSASIDVMFNDSDSDGDTLTIDSFGQGTSGSVTQAGDNLVYTPNAGFSGSDTFSYTIADGNGGFATASVGVTVAAGGTLITEDFSNASLGNFTVVSGGTWAVAGNELTLTSPANGNPLGNLILHNTAVSGDFTATVDSRLVTPASSWGDVDVVFNYQDANHYYIASFNQQNGVGTHGIQKVDNGVATEIADFSAASLISEDVNYEVRIVRSGNTIEAYRDNVLLVSATDSSFTGGKIGLASKNDTVAFDNLLVVGANTPVNQPPVANNDTASSDEDTSVSIAVLANDTDLDGDTLSIDSFGQASSGTVAQSGNSLVYTPNANFNGTDSFTYTASDGNGGTDTATVNVTVTAVNDNPVAVNNNATTNEDTSVSIAVLANDTDLDGDTLSIDSFGQASNGTVAQSGNSLVYTPNANFNGTDSFTYTASDGNGGADTATVNVTVTAVNDSPVAVNNNATTNEDTSVSIAVLANDTDLDGDALSIDSFGQASNGTVAQSGNSLVYTPSANFNGTDSFTYTASDGNGGTDTATVNVTVTAVNDNPVADNETASTDAGVAVTVDVLVGDTDVDGDSLAVASVTQGANGVVVNNGTSVTYTPNANFSGSDSFAYTVSDGNGGADTATVDVTVNPVVFTSISEDFSTSSLGNFSVVSGGVWSVSAGELILTNPANANPLGNVILHNTVTPSDFTATVTGRLVTPASSWGDVDVVFNYQDANHYYIASFNEQNGSGTHGIQKVENGVATEIADFSAASLISEYVNYEFKIVRSGDTIEAYQDNVLLASFTDSSYIGGQIGLATKNDTVAFDNLSVDVLAPLSINEDFGTNSIANFTAVSGGTWSVAAGELTLTNPANANPLGNVILHNTAMPGDFTATVTGRLVTPASSWGDIDVVFNYQDANHYYIVSFNQRYGSGTHGIQKVENGVTTEIADFSAASLISEDVNYEFKIVRSGSTIEAYQDNVLLASVADSSYTGGQIGLASKNDTVSFDNLLVESGASGSSGGEGESLQVAASVQPVFLARADRLDVDGNGNITALDALQVINQLNRDPDVAEGLVESRFDASGDGRITALDALMVINRLGRSTDKSPSGEMVSATDLAIPSISDRSMKGSWMDDDLLQLLADDSL